jgi:hypothetical protein
MKKINAKILILSFAVTAVVLFGGWFGVQYLGSEKPITDWVTAHEGIDIEELVIDQRKIYVEIDFQNDKEFGLTYLQFKHFLTQVGNGKEIIIEVRPEFGQHHPWWLNHSAGIIEFIKNKEYTNIEERINQWTEEGILKDGKMQMNSEYIFIYLQPVESKPIYLIFPIHAQQGGGLSD